MAVHLMYTMSFRSLLPVPQLKESRTLRRARVPWSTLEEANLRKGIHLFGEGNWRQILDHFMFDGRSNMDLKDKWRNIKKKEGC